MELQHFSHQHPLVFNEEQQSQLQSETKIHCSGCGDQLVSGLHFSCVDCKFYLHKQCAEAPSQMNHPFHRNHSLHLFVSSPYPAGTIIICDFCNKICDGERFIYHCSCGLDFHIKCALLSFNIAEKGIAAFQHNPRISSDQNRPENLEKAKCFACWKPLTDSLYFSPDCGFHLHVKCVDLPAQINHHFHPQHPLILQFNHQRLSCQICQNPQNRGFVYCCCSSSSCNFVLHIECAKMPTKKLVHRKHPLLLRIVDQPLPCQICQQTQRNQEAVYFCSKCKFVLHSDCVSPPPVIEDKVHHEHPFVLRPKQVSLICDACGTSGDYIPYICSTCNIIVHKKCISLPRIIQFFRHHHPISHTYSLEERGFETWECRHCYEEVNTEYGTYFCSKCNYIVHVNCALEQPYFYHEVDSLETDDVMELSFLEVTETSIKHISHDHNLTLSEETDQGNIMGDKQYDGCLLSISSGSCYYCSQCDFFLHKSCAELPMKKHIWYHFFHRLLRLTWGCIFQCAICGYETSGFAYNCDECEERHCLPCSLVSDITRCEGHEHLLRFYQKCNGFCNACGAETKAAYRCKSCNFTSHNKCLRLPLIAQHKCDEHPLELTCEDKNSYSISHFCDICEDDRNPNLWFYHCATCDSSAHPNCVLGKFSFIKPGSICKLGDHSHPLTFVQKVHDYPECLICGKPCIDLALQCNKIGCSYIVHWKCIKPLIPFGKTTTIKLLSEVDTNN